MTDVDITSDNLHLSEPTPHADVSAPTTNPFADACTDPMVLHFIEAATAPNTQRAYDSDLKHFLAWGGSLPANPDVVARYLAAHATTHAVASLARRLVAIRRAHALHGLPDPVRSELVRLTFRGIRRAHGRPQHRAAALTSEEMAAIMASLGDCVRDARDRALLLIGFAGAFRRSELSRVDCKSIERTSRGIVVTIPKSKTDQEGQTRQVAIPHGRSPICPIKALDQWLELSRITEGPVFRPVTRRGHVLPGRLSGDSIAKIIKHRVKTIGLDPTRYSGHSLRAGFVTSAATAGAPAWRIKAQTGHASDALVGRYIRLSDPFAANAGRPWRFSNHVTKGSRPKNYGPTLGQILCPKRTKSRPSPARSANAEAPHSARLGARKVAEIDCANVARLHADLKSTPCMLE